MTKAIAAFGEDRAHREIIGALIARVAKELGLSVQVDWRNARRGHGKVVSELKEYFRDLSAQGSRCDLIVVATDANCKGLNERAQELRAQSSPIETVLAIPDPHVERWLLLDGEAFKKVLGKGCQAPDQKCDRGRYKDALNRAISDAGKTPLISSIEWASDIIDKMDLARATGADPSLKRFLDDLRKALQAVPSDRDP